MPVIQTAIQWVVRGL